LKERLKLIRCIGKNREGKEFIKINSILEIRELWVEKKPIKFIFEIS